MNLFNYHQHATDLIMSSFRKKVVCYFCGEEKNKSECRLTPVLESPKNADCPPKVFMCEDCDIELGCYED